MMAAPSPTNRIAHLDGLRGVAAAIVAISHLFCAFRPAINYGAEAGVAASWQTWFATSPLFVMANGNFAVFVFFVLSGFVIAASTDASRGSIALACIARFLRLAIPCGACVLLAAVIINGRLGWTAQVAEIAPHWWISGSFRVEPLPAWKVLAHAGGIYFWTGGSIFNGALWTMQRELLGSLAILIVMGAVRGDGLRAGLAILLSASLVYFKAEPHFYLCFAAGALLYLMRTRLARLPSWLGGLTLAAGLLLGSKPVLPPPPGSFYYTVQGDLFSTWAWPVGSMLIVVGTLLFAPAIKLLGSGIGRFLGRISFGLYLVHMLIIQSLMSYLFVKWGSAGPWALALGIVIYLTVTLATAYAFTVLVDEPATGATRMIKAWGKSNQYRPVFKTGLEWIRDQSARINPRSP